MQNQPHNIKNKSKLKHQLLPLLIHALWGTPVAAGCDVGPEPPNISANGFPSCNKSSDAFVFPKCDVVSMPVCPVGEPNRSTIGAEVCVDGGDDRNGFVRAPFVGDAIFVWIQKYH